MTIHLDLPCYLEEQLRQEAAVSGQPLDKLVLNTLLEKYSAAPCDTPVSYEEWNTLLQETINLHPQGTNELVVSRDSIYLKVYPA